MRFLITGTAGFIGFHLARRLLDDGHLVVPRELAAVVAKEVDLGGVPQRLGVEQQAVHVEDDGPIPTVQRHA